MFSFCDLYELEAYHVPLDLQKVEYYYRNNPDQPILTTVGEDKHVTILAKERGYYDDGSSTNRDYVLIPSKLSVRRFNTVSLCLTWKNGNLPPKMRALSSRTNFRDSLSEGNP